VSQNRLILALAFRNLLRNLRRTVITGGAVVAGVAVMIMGWGLVDGLDENVLRAQEGTVTGQVVLRPDGWPEQGTAFPLDEAQLPSPALVAALDADERIEAWTGRTWFQGRAVAGTEGITVRGFTYDPERDARVFDREGWKLDGAWPAAPEEVVIGQWLAGILQRGPGEELVIEARTRSGAINALRLKVSGVISTGTPAADRVVWIPLPQGETLLGLEGAVSMIALRLPRRSLAEEVAASLGGQGWRATTVMWETRDILSINAFRRRAIALVVVILMLIAATGIANTVIMAAYERVREIGTLRAMGMTPGQIRALFLVEGAVLGSVAGLSGALIGVVVVAWYARHGIDLSQVANNVGDMAMASTLYMRFSWPPVLGALGFGLGVALLASLWPAHHAASLNPADAVRAD